MSAETKCIQVFILKMASLNNEGIMKQVNVIRKRVLNVWKKYQGIKSTFHNPIPGSNT